MSTQTNTLAPDFTLQNTNGDEISLSSFKGDKNVVLFFFPLAFTGTCTEELCTTRDNMKLYDSLDAEVIAISVDSFFTLNEFNRNQNLNFTLFSDFNREVAEKYNVLYDDFFGMEGVAKRSAFVIDKEGAIQYQEILEDAGELPDFKKIQETLNNIAK